MALWPFSKQEKAAPERSAKDSPQQPSIVYINDSSAMAIISWNDSIAAESALQHPVAGRAIDKLATSVSQARWFVEEDPHANKSERSGNTAKMKALQSLLDFPNDDMTPSMLRYWMTQNYACYGRVALKIGHGAIYPDIANGIYPLETAQTNAKRNDRGTIDRYEYGTGENKTEYTSRLKWKPGQAGGFVDQIYKPSLKGFADPNARNSPLHSIGLPLKVTRALLIRAIKAAEGHPNVRYMVTCSRTLTKAQVDALREHLNQDHGPSGPDAGKIPILQNAGEVVIHKLDNDLSDIHSKLPLDDMQRLIFGAFGIPIALAGIGAADSAKFAGNFDGSRAAFWQDTIVPSYISPLFEGLTRMICPAGVRISPDLDSIPALLPARITAMREASGIMFLTETEKREMFGWAPVKKLGEGEELPPPANPPINLPGANNQPGSVDTSPGQQQPKPEDGKEKK